MSDEIQSLEVENAKLKAQIRIMNFPNEQATHCGKCGEFKHTPWKDNECGFVCASCLVAIKDEEIAKSKEPVPPPLRLLDETKK